MHAAAFSCDGSLLAVAGGATVTLWDARSTSLLGVLPAPAGATGSAPVAHLALLAGSPYLVGGTAFGIALVLPLAPTVIGSALILPINARQRRGAWGDCWFGKKGQQNLRARGCPCTAPLTHKLAHVYCCVQVAGSSTHLTLYNLLTSTAEWCRPLPVAALAADPASQHFAVVLPPGTGAVLAQQEEQGGATAGGEQQHRKQQQRVGGAAGSVLVFRGAGRQPVGGWVLRRAEGAQLAFALPGTPLHSSAVGVSHQRLLFVIPAAK